MSEIVMGLAKFGQQAHVESTLGGNLHIRKLGYYLELEDGKVRGDPDEGLAVHHQPDQVTIEIAGRIIDRTSIVGAIKARYAYVEAQHIYCLHALTWSRILRVLNDGVDAVDQRNLQFGDYLCAICNVPEFLVRVENALAARDLSWTKGLVEYYGNDDHREDLHPLCKNAAYEYQSEYRFLIHGHTGDILTLDVGDLSDIAFVAPAREAIHQIRISKNTTED